MLSQSATRRGYLAETECSENRPFSPPRSIRLGRRRSGVQIAPPRPIESSPWAAHPDSAFAGGGCYARINNDAARHICFAISCLKFLRLLNINTLQGSQPLLLGQWDRSVTMLVRERSGCVNLPRRTWVCERPPTSGWRVTGAVVAQGAGRPVAPPFRSDRREDAAIRWPDRQRSLVRCESAPQQPSPHLGPPVPRGGGENWRD